MQRISNLNPIKATSALLPNMDDGGAAKSNDRLYRRKRRRILEIISLPLGILCIIFLLMKVQLQLNKKLDSKRINDKFLLGRMKKNFQNQDNVVSSDKNSDSDSNSHKYIMNSEPGYGIQSSHKKKHRWIDLRQIPPIHNAKEWLQQYLPKNNQDHNKIPIPNRNDFRVTYSSQKLWWETLADQAGIQPPKVDYTQHTYTYPTINQSSTSTPPNDGSYPNLQTMEQIFKKWPQDDIDNPPNPFQETLLHFDYQNPNEMKIAMMYRNLELPFKVYNIPEITNAGMKWTDDYLSYHFDRKNHNPSRMMRGGGVEKDEYKYGPSTMPPSQGRAQYSIDSFFAFFINRNWNIDKLGPPPTLDTDLTFERWAKHAVYADAVSLPNNEVHYYWQSGVPSEEKERPKEKWSMISHDLPSFSVRGNEEPSFFSFHPKEQKGIQCRFGERGVTAATHYDGGRNMVGMITGAKRYILSPPKECSKV